MLKQQRTSSNAHRRPRFCYGTSEYLTQ